MTPAEKLVYDIARLEKWQPGDERVPSDGLQDSHDTLMDIIDEARALLPPQPGRAEPPLTNSMRDMRSIDYRTFCSRCGETYGQHYADACPTAPDGGPNPQMSFEPVKPQKQRGGET